MVVTIRSTGPASTSVLRIEFVALATSSAKILIWRHQIMGGGRSWIVLLRSVVRKLCIKQKSVALPC